MKSLDPGLLVGELLQGTYEVEELVGEGGMAFVYRARHRILDGPVALKILQRRFAHREDIRERFLREARLQYRLHHPHIVRVLDFLEDHGLVGCVQEWCNGGELTQELLEVPPLEAYAILEQQFLPLLSALGYVHDLGYIHRDIKPANILLHEHAGGTLWKLSDFGLLKDQQAEQLTRSGTIVGTFHYISPEQFEESNKVDLRTDLYSMGVVLYQLLMKRVPFTASMPRLAIQIFDALPEFPPELPISLRHFLETALAKKPEARFSSCHEMEEQLRAVLRDLQEAEEKSEPILGTLSGPVMEPDVPLLPDPSVELTRGSVDLRSVEFAQRSISEIPRSQKENDYKQNAVWWFLISLVLGAGLWFYLKSSRTPPQNSGPLFHKKNLVSKEELRELSLNATRSRAITYAQKGNWGSTRFFLRLLCKADPHSCYWAARWRHFTKRVMRKGCKLGDSVSCHWEKVIRRKKPDARSFVKRAIPLYRKACNGGVAKACHDLSQLRELPAKERAVMVKKACKLGVGSACVRWAKVLLDAKNDPTEAWKQACKRNSVEGCFQLARSLRASSSASAKKRAQRFFKRTCELGDPRGCRSLQTFQVPTRK